MPGTFGYKVLQTSVIFQYAVGVLGFVRHNVSGFKSVALCRAQDASFIRARAFTALQLTPKVSVPSRGLTKKVKIAVRILKQDTESHNLRDKEFLILADGVLIENLSVRVTARGLQLSKGITRTVKTLSATSGAGKSVTFSAGIRHKT